VCNVHNNKIVETWLLKNTNHKTQLSIIFDSYDVLFLKFQKVFLSLKYVSDKMQTGSCTIDVTLVAVSRHCERGENNVSASSYNSMNYNTSIRGIMTMRERYKFIYLLTYLLTYIIREKAT